MKKLKSKVFIVLFLILTSSLIIMLSIFNYQYYQSEKSSIERKLIRLETNKLNDYEKIFIDLDSFIITYDNNKNITGIISYNNENINDRITKYANVIIKHSNKKKYIGNLYVNKYSYVVKNNNILIMISNETARNNLKFYLKSSISVFLIIEIIMLYLSKVLTDYITKPASDAFDKQKSFIMDASHELKTPITVILANAEALENDRNNNKWLNNIKNESERMNKLVNDLLTLAKTENELNEIVLTNNNISKIVEKSLLTFESLMFEKNIKLEEKIKENIRLNSDEEKIKCLMSILIDNAIKHSDKEGHIIVNLFKNKNNVILEVINKGKPIPKEDEEKIFERFFREDKSRNRNDNRYGLGLAIAKNIVNSHNGEIKASSKDGYTTFKVSFKN